MKAADPDLQLNDETYRKAAEYMYEVHFPIGKINQPEPLRAKGLIAGIARLGYTFRSFPHNMLSQLALSVYNGSSKANFDVLARSLAYVMVLGGGASLPFVDDLLDLLERMSNTPYRLRAKQFLEKHGGEWFANMGLFGIPAMMRVDVSGSLKLGLPFTNGIDQTLFGAMAGLD